MRAFDPVESAEFLVLDDAGQEGATEWARKAELTISSARLAADRRTVVTTRHWTAPELVIGFAEGQEGMRMVSRQFGVCAADRVRGPDQQLALLGTWGVN